MLGKSIVAGTVLTLLAGSVVYYGTDVDATATIETSANKLEKMVASTDEKSSDSGTSNTGYMTESHPHKGDTSEGSKSASDIPSFKSNNAKLIDPKADTVIEAAPAAEIVSPVEDSSSDEANVQSETPTRKWIDQYLKSESKTETIDAETTDTDADNDTDTDADAKAATKVMAEDTSPSDAELEIEIAKALAEDAKIAEVFAQEDAIEKELADMMSEMADTEMLETLDVKSNETEIEGTELELFTKDKILEAETKGFEDRARNIENIWKNEDGAHGASDFDSETLHKMMKKHDTEENDTPATVENEVIDLGNSKITILRAENVEGHPASGHSSPEGNELNVIPKVRPHKKVMDCIEPELEHNIYKIRKMKKKHGHSNHTKLGNQKIAPVKEGLDKKCEDAPHENGKVGVSETVKIIMEQAEKISMSELRDRAYLDLVSYALDNNDTAAANIAMSKIEQVELRDTARNRMAVAYAKNGNAPKAFAILEDIEVAALRDVMRLQVIEALITPKTKTQEHMK